MANPKFQILKFQWYDCIPILDPNSGPSDDWAKGVAGINYTYTIELRDQGPVYGFLLPAE